MKKLAILLSIIILFQSCYSYKNTTANNLEVDEYYEMRLNNETNIRGIYQAMSKDSVEIRIKHRLLKYSKKNLSDIKRRRTSILKTLGVFAVMMTGLVLSVTTNNPEKVSDEFSRNPND